MEGGLKKKKAKRTAGGIHGMDGALAVAMHAYGGRGCEPVGIVASRVACSYMAGYIVLSRRPADSTQSGPSRARVIFPHRA